MFKKKLIRILIPFIALLLLNVIAFAQKTKQQLEKEIVALSKQIEEKKKEIEKNKLKEKQLKDKQLKDKAKEKKATKSDKIEKVKIVKADKEITDSNKNDSEVKKAGKIYTGTASFYSAKFEGRRTANGEIFKHAGFTAACNQLPLGTWLKITNLKNGKTVVVKINDRMHPKMNRLVDLTLAAAKKLDFVDNGLANVKAEVIKHK